jgi:predicted ATPase
VLILEDLHWADEMSVRLLSFLGRRVPGWPVLVVATAREEELADAVALRLTLGELRGEGHFGELVLAPLSRHDTARLVRLLSRAGSESTTAARWRSRRGPRARATRSWWWRRFGRYGKA